MGHTFGANHTHCTDTSALAGIQPIDFCWSAECGTSWNPPAAASCPAPFTISPAHGTPIDAVRGTLMSYCDKLAGCAVANVFHPSSISLAIAPELDDAVGRCVFPVPPPPPGSLYTLTPCRLVDTRNAAGPLGGPALGAGARRDFPLAGACGIPADAKALSLNVTVTGPTEAGFLSLFPADLGLAPSHSTINFSAGQTRANNTVVPLAANGAGTLAVRNGSAGGVNLIVDVNGYFQ
jgi:hypothetical protein